MAGDILWGEKKEKYWPKEKNKITFCTVAWEKILFQIKSTFKL